MNSYISLFYYVLIVLICSFGLPYRAWINGKRTPLAIFLACIGLFFCDMMYGYFKAPVSTEDHGAVVFGFIFIIPIFSFLLQLMVYIGYKVMKHNSAK